MCPIIWPRDNVLGPVLLLWYLVVSLSHGQKNEKKITAYLWHTKPANSIPIFLSYNQSPFVPAFVHIAVYDCMTKALPLWNSFFSLCLSMSVCLSVYLSSQPPSSLLCCSSDHSFLRPSLLVSNFFPPSKVSLLIYSAQIKSCKLNFPNLINVSVNFWLLISSSPYFQGHSWPPCFSNFLYLHLFGELSSACRE